MQLEVGKFDQLFELLRLERHYLSRFKEHLAAAAALTQDPGCSVQVKQMFLGHIEEEETEHLEKLDLLLASIETSENLPATSNGKSAFTVGSLIGR